MYFTCERIASHNHLYIVVKEPGTGAPRRECLWLAGSIGSSEVEGQKKKLLPCGQGNLSFPSRQALRLWQEPPERKIWRWEITAPGQVRIERTGTTNRGHLLVGVPGYQEFDSLAVDSAGYVCVATLHNGGITVIAPDGTSVEYIPMPDPVTTNICFGGPDLRTAYITLSQKGRLVSMPWPRPGLALHYLHR